MRKFAAPLALLLTSTACTTMEAAPAPVAAAADRMVSPILTSPEAVDTLTHAQPQVCLLYTSPSPRDKSSSRMPSSA